MKEIDELIHGALTNEDEEAVEDEYNELIKDSLPIVPEEKISDEVELELPEIPSKPGNYNRVRLFFYKLITTICYSC